MQKCAMSGAFSAGASATCVAPEPAAAVGTNVAALSARSVFTVTKAILPAARRPEKRGASLCICSVRTASGHEGQRVVQKSSTAYLPANSAASDVAAPTAPPVRSRTSTASGLEESAAPGDGKTAEGEAALAREVA